MNRRDILRSTLFGAVAAATTVTPVAAREFPAGFDAYKELGRADWKPVFLDNHQNETLIALSEHIIPATDTPGAKAALVNRFLDLVLSVETVENQRAFLAALSYLDGACREEYKASFIYLDRDQQIEFLNLIAYPHSESTWGGQPEEFPAYTHFSKLKDWVANAYYSSPAGLKEMGWDGSFPHGDFAGCPHDEGGHQTEQ